MIQVRLIHSMELRLHSYTKSNECQLLVWPESFTILISYLAYSHYLVTLIGGLYSCMPSNIG